MQGEGHKSYAKINLGLNVLRKRDDGYHDIETIFQQIDLYDELSFSKTGSPGISITSNEPTLPLDSSNLVHVAITKLFEYSGESFGVHVFIDKKIPAGGGLGGGSSNAALALSIVNSMLKKPLSSEELMQIGVGIGSDVPFFLLGGTAFGQNRGEKLTQISLEFKGLDMSSLSWNPRVNRMGL